MRREFVCRADDALGVRDHGEDESDAHDHVVPRAEGQGPVQQDGQQAAGSHDTGHDAAGQGGDARQVGGGEQAEAADRGEHLTALGTPCSGWPG
ncbi:hypothetical protein [Streptomyces sp. 3213.3]|uniref:hypothetical protein n=1 Tax=Streptomyces sp. 3213.3 TaxID=1855348 RepID=UPI00190EF5FF|nr:hypothetical protein [Streptomyces sp. 3213.3]